MNVFQQQLQRLRQQQQLLYIMVFSMVTLLVWVAISLVSAQKKTGIAKELLDLAKPLTPTLNRQVFDSLESKRTFSASELEAFPIYTIITNEDGTERVVTLDQVPVTPAPAARTGPATIPAPVPISATPTPIPSTASGSATTPPPATTSPTPAATATPAPPPPTTP